MQTYILRRLMLMAPMLIAVSIVIFGILRVMPGDVTIAITGGVGGDTLSLTEEEKAHIQRQWGLDKPLYFQYLTWIGGVLKGDFGTSFWYKTPIRDELAQRYPVTVELAFFSSLMSFVFALPLGILAALKQDSWIDYVFRVISVLGLAIPSFWLGILLLLFTSTQLKWTPPFGYVSLWVDPKTNFLQFFLPVITLGFALSGILSRMLRSQLLEVLREDYVRTAWAKGLRQRAVILRHALKNALLPVITISAIQLGVILGGAVVTETVFVLPGLGRSLVDAVGKRDYPFVQAIVLLIGVTFMLINLGVDVVYHWIDPRIRFS
ncbi:MAG: ABC transporter permease [Dehalococcoidia bacterium]